MKRGILSEPGLMPNLISVLTFQEINRGGGRDNKIRSLQAMMEYRK